ncbi:hypothetical protein KACC15558_18980 [Brevibacterium ammoniilyticum]|uniref:Uncharacterized protein n=1 Tax=Brevibacterium ammoniilyticum TaxID=1046555 RepID=A0ABP9TZR3_9MICO
MPRAWCSFFSGSDEFVSGSDEVVRAGSGQWSLAAMIVTCITEWDSGGPGRGIPRSPGRGPPLP